MAKKATPKKGRTAPSPRPPVTIKVLEAIWSTVVGRLDPGMYVRVAADHADWFVERKRAALATSQAQLWADLSRDAWLVHWDARPGELWTHPVTGTRCQQPEYGGDFFGPGVSMSETSVFDRELQRTVIRRKFTSAEVDQPGARDALRKMCWDTSPLGMLELAEANLRRLGDHDVPEHSAGVTALAPAFEARLRAGPRGQLLQRDADAVKDALAAFAPIYMDGRRRINARYEQSQKQSRAASLGRKGGKAKADATEAKLKSTGGVPRKERIRAAYSKQLGEGVDPDAISKNVADQFGVSRQYVRKLCPRRKNAIVA